MKKVIKFYNLLKNYWSTIVAGISIIGYFLAYLVPPLKEYSALFVFLGVNVVVWSIIEIKLKILETVPEKRFSSLRDARNEIVRRIYAEIKNGKKKNNEIQILGGRIRTISDIVREVLNEGISGNINIKNTTFKIYCISPDFIKTMKLPPSPNDLEVIKRNQRYSDMVSQFSSELLGYNKNKSFSSSNNKIEIVYYNFYPIDYFFIIGDKTIFWGFFIWDEESEDFEGPANPCYYIKDGDERFVDSLKWLKNRLLFYKSLNL